MSGPVTAGQRRAWQAGCVAVGLAALAVLLGGPYQSLLGTVVGSGADDVRAAPCLPGQAVPIMDSPHISQARAASVAYNSLPPTSGPHFAFSIAPGVYDTSVADGLAVHALEHGHIVIRYAPDLPAHQVDALAGLARRYGAEVVLAPYPPLPEGIALTAWGRIELLDAVDESRVVEFIEALSGRYHHGWTTDVDCPRPAGSAHPVRVQ